MTSSNAHRRLTLGSLISTPLLVSLLAITSTADAQVKSKTTEEFKQYGPEDAYWVFTATCADDSTRIIQRKTDGNDWCVKDVDGFCDEDRDSAASKACSDAYTAAAGSVKQQQAEKRQADQQAQQAAAAEQEQAQAAQREKERAAAAAAERDRQARLKREQQAKAEADAKKAAEEKAAAESAEQIAIEEELLKIEQEKLDLRRQELELQQRAVEIQKKLDESGT